MSNILLLAECEVEKQTFELSQLTAIIIEFYEIHATRNYGSCVVVQIDCCKQLMSHSILWESELWELQ